MVLRIEVVRILKIVIANQKDDIPAEMDEVGNDLFQATDAMAWFSAWLWDTHGTMASVHCRGPQQESTKG